MEALEMGSTVLSQPSSVFLSASSLSLACRVFFLWRRQKTGTIGGVNRKQKTAAQVVPKVQQQSPRTDMPQRSFLSRATSGLGKVWLGLPVQGVY